MRDLFKDYQISEDYKNNNFILSLSNQYKKSNLTNNQIYVLNSILEKEEEIIIPNFKKYYVVKEYFNKTDYHGDYMIDHKLLFIDSLESINLNESISDYNAADHGVVIEHNKYEIKETLLVTTKMDVYVYYYDYKQKVEHILERLEKNNFRKNKVKYDYIRAINSIYEGCPNKYILKKIFFKY